MYAYLNSILQDDDLIQCLIAFIAIKWIFNQDSTNNAYEHRKQREGLFPQL